ncbi:MAG: ferritin-like domain-containing protein [Acidimicrobiia bacterium]
MSDLSRDEIRRSLRDAEAEQAAALPAYRELLLRWFDPESKVGAGADLPERAALLGDLTRRRAVRLGGIGVLSAAVLAACGKKDNTVDSIAQSGVPDEAGKAPTSVVDDLVLVRTASSLEHLAVDLYDRAAKSGLITTGAIADVAALFRAHHAEHAALFEAVTKQVGGEPYTEANPVLAAKVEPLFTALKSEGDVVIFAHTVENLATDTYQSTVALFSTPKFRQAAMSVGAVEARHAALLAGVLASKSIIPNSAAVPVAAAPAAAGGGATATTAAPTVPPVYQVPGAFGTVDKAIGANSYMYYATAESE